MKGYLMRKGIVFLVVAALVMGVGISAAQMQRGGPMMGCPWMPDYTGRMHGMMGDMHQMMNMPMTPEQQQQMMNMMGQMGTMMNQMCGPQAAQMQPQHEKQLQDMQKNLNSMKQQLQKKQ